MHFPDQASYRLLRLPDVMRMTGLRRTTIYKHIAHPPSDSPPFPRAVKLGRASAWLESEVIGWIEARKAARDAS